MAQASPWPTAEELGPRSVQMASTMSVRLEGQGNLADGTTRFEFGLVNQGFAWAFPSPGCEHRCGQLYRTRAR